MSASIKQLLRVARASRDAGSGEVAIVVDALMERGYSRERALRATSAGGPHEAHRAAFLAHWLWLIGLWATPEREVPCCPRCGSTVGSTRYGFACHNPACARLFAKPDYAKRRPYGEPDYRALAHVYYERWRGRLNDPAKEAASADLMIATRAHMINLPEP